MKAGVFFAGTGSILILTSFDSLTARELVNKLSIKGYLRKLSADKFNVDLLQRFFK